MKSVLKVLLVKALLFLLTSSAAAQVAMAAGNFFDPQGNVGSVVVFRDSTNLTQLYYDFCTTQAVAACQRGNGYIQNSAFKGKVSTGLNQASVLTLLVDTSNTGTSFSNWTCFNYDPLVGECDGGTAPAIGGLINLSFTKTRDWATVNTITNKRYTFGRVTFNGIDAQYGFAAHLQGTVLGLTINVVGIDPDGLTNWMSTENNSANASQRFKAAKRR